MESDSEFLDMMWGYMSDIRRKDEHYKRLFALARRGAAVADQERKQRAFMGDPLKGVTIPPPPAGET